VFYPPLLWLVGNYPQRGFFWGV